MARGYMLLHQRVGDCSHKVERMRSLVTFALPTSCACACVLRLAGLHCRGGTAGQVNRPLHIPGVVWLLLLHAPTYTRLTECSVCTLGLLPVWPQHC
jgi:hypothetical protein